MQSTEQQTDDLNTLMSNFESRCYVTPPSNNRISDNMKKREKSRPSSGNETPGVMRQKSVYTAGKVSVAFFYSVFLCL